MNALSARIDRIPLLRRDPQHRRAWIPITGGELVLLGVTASLPKNWTGWSAHFVRDAVNHLGEAWSKPPMIDTDRWYHNYVGHPYGGSLYYNSVRCQGATVGESFAMSVILSTEKLFIILFNPMSPIMAGD